MSASRRTLQQEFEEWKQALPMPAGGPKAEAARQLRDSVRVFTFGFRDWLEATMRPQGMTLPQLRMLFAVRYGEHASSAKIARLCQVTPQTLQAMLQRAVREGWLTRTPAEHNARILVSALTPKGDALLQQAVEATTAFELQVWRDTTTAELRAIHAAFTRATQRIGRDDAGSHVARKHGETPKPAAKR